MPVTTYMSNTGGLNLTDSPITMQDNQATGQSYNYDYVRTGAISKVLGTAPLNSSPDSQLKTFGLGMYHSADTDVRTLIRAAGSKIQTCNTTTGATTTLSSDDAVPISDFLTSTSTQPVVFAPFNTVAGGTHLWMAGGGMNAVYGYTGSNITQNGTPSPTGSIAASVNTHDSGTFTTADTYVYAVQFRKLGTQALSNVTLDVSATIVNLDDTVTINLSGITNLDTTRFDQIYIYRSIPGGSSAFTTGSLIAQLPSTTTSYRDTGTSIDDSENIARANNLILDNSELSTGTYKYVTAFKRRLVTASGSTIYLSDLNKPESWPTVNSVTVPSGGPITALGVIGVPSEYTTGAAEYLCIWKERELWVLTGNDISDWDLLFVDKTGSASQSLVVAFNGFVTWISYNGIYMWDGRGRPSRVSRPINALFEADGDLDKAHLSQGYACQYEKGNQIIWRVSHKIKGLNKLSIKMDTRLTSQAASTNLQNPEMDGVFTLDTDSNAYYSICSFRPSNYEEIVLTGDGAGYVYQLYNSAATAVSFDYETKPLDMGHPEMLKYFKRVFAYIEKLTDNDLTLYYWADYRNRDEYKSEVSASMAPFKGTQPALFDIALFDQAFFDDYLPDISPIEFNLHSNENNSVGTSLKLRFEQLDANAPVRIHGFAIEWEPVETLATPSQQVI